MIVQKTCGSRDQELASRLPGVCISRSGTRTCCFATRKPTRVNKAVNGLRHQGPWRPKGHVHLPNFPTRRGSSRKLEFFENLPSRENEKRSTNFQKRPSLRRCIGSLNLHTHRLILALLEPNRILYFRDIFKLKLNFFAFRRTRNYLHPSSSHQPPPWPRKPNKSKHLPLHRDILNSSMLIPWLRTFVLMFVSSITSHAQVLTWTGSQELESRGQGEWANRSGLRRTWNLRA